MALKVLMLKKKIDDSNKALEALRAKDADFSRREAEIEASISEAETEEERSAVDEAISGFEAEKAEHEEAKASLERTVSDLEAELTEAEAAQATPAPVADNNNRKDEKIMSISTRSNFYGMTRDQQNEFFTRDDVKNYLDEVRSCITEKRALTNVGLTIPAVFLGLLRENLINYSKLYRHVYVRAIGGTGTLVIEGTIPEAVWTDCCANLNELDLTFNNVEVDCWRVGGYFAICNATLEDSDVDLADELLTALGKAIGFALDKAILYGTGTRMPLGVVTRLAQTAEPADYPATARAWADLHTSNIQSIAASVKGNNLVSAIVEASGAAKGAYSRGEKVWVMNETTYTKLMAQTVATTAAGQIVAGIAATMPVVGGIIEVLNFIPDNVIIGGYFDLYLLAERAGAKFATSEHVRFLQDQTVFKGTARYDGQPTIAEAFVAIGINGVTPNATMTFAPDTANA